MSKFNINIIIYSELNEFGGGRETWLNYFLEGIMNEEDICKINIYNIKPKEAELSIKNKFLNNDKITFNEVDIYDCKISNSFSRILYYAYKTAKMCKENKIENNKNIYLIIGTLAEGVSGIILSKLIKNAIIITWIRSKTVGEILSRKSKLYGYLTNIVEKNIVSLSSGVITNGQDTLIYYKQKYNNIKDKFTSIENAVCVETFSDIKEINKSSATINIAFMGRLARAKGFPEFMESIEVFRRESPKCVKKINFNIYGYGECENLLNDKVIYHGKYTPQNIQEILSSNEVIVFLNKTENAGGLSHSLLEAMAAGRLIIAWDNLIHNQVLNKENSFLISEGNVRELAKIFNYIIDMDEMEWENKSKQVAIKSSDYDTKNHVSKFLNYLSSY